jgi:hypothetical protein
MRLRKQTEHACLKKVVNNASDVLAGSSLNVNQTKVIIREYLVETITTNNLVAK